MSALTDMLQEPDDPRSSVEIALDLLCDSDREAMEDALRNSQFPSRQLRTAFATDGVVADAGRVPTADAIYNYRRRAGWL
ncbi:hypothetical protein GCM10009700_35120 [Brevibacterium sanguinis]